MAEPREEIEQLLHYLLPVAEEQLNREGAFRPYAATRLPRAKAPAAGRTARVDAVTGAGCGASVEAGFTVPAAIPRGL